MQTMATATAATTQSASAKLGSTCVGTGVTEQMCQDFLDFSADPVRRNSPEAARAQFGQLTSLSSAGLLYQYIVNAPSANDLVPVLAIVAANPNVFDKGTLQACNDRLKTFFADQEAASNEDITALSAAISKARNPLLP